MGTYENNLKQLSPDLQAQLTKQSGNAAENLMVVEARNGNPSLKGVKNGHETWLHSGYDPEKEAERWAANIELEKHNIVIVVGFGLGYHVEFLMKKAQQIGGIKVFVIEPELELFKIALQYRRFSNLMNDNNLHLILSDNETVIHNKLKPHIRIGHVKDIVFHCFYPVFNYFPRNINTLEMIRSFINNAYIDRNTFIRFGREWTFNSLKNMPYLLRSSSVSKLKGAFKDLPAIIVSTGPSLDKNIHLLKEAKGKALIIALGSSLKPILNQGVDPDIVFTIDSSDANAHNFVDLQQEDVQNSHLVYVPELHPAIPPLFGEKLFLGMSPYSLPWLDELLDKLPEPFASGPSVANYVLDFIVKTGADPIILIGQDLALTAESSHAAGAPNKKLKTDISKQEELIKVEDINGRMVDTTRTMYAMLSWFNKYISIMVSNSKVIDATEGGALIAGTEIMTLQECLDTYCKEKQPIDEIINKSSTVKMGGNLSANELESLIVTTSLECDEAKVNAKKGYTTSLRFQEMIAGGTYAGKKLHKRYESMHQSYNAFNQIDKFRKISALMLQVLVRIFDEGLLMANREEKFSREHGLGIAKSYQFFFTQVEEVATMIAGYLEKSKELLFEKETA